MDFHEINGQGEIWIQRVDDINLIGHTSDDESRLVYSKSNDKVYIGTSTEWRDLAIEYSVMEQGAKMLFGSYPLPIGWNIGNRNDEVVLITNSSGSIGAESGTWVISQMNNSNAHDHGGRTNRATVKISLKKYDAHKVYRPLWNHRHSIMADGIHTHTFDGNWRPEYIKFCEGVLQ